MIETNNGSTLHDDETKDAAEITEDTVPNASIDSFAPPAVEKPSEDSADKESAKNVRPLAGATKPVCAEAPSDETSRASSSPHAQKKEEGSPVTQINASRNQMDIIHYVAACRASDAPRLDDVTLINDILNDAKKMGMHEFVSVAESLLNKARLEIARGKHVA